MYVQFDHNHQRNPQQQQKKELKKSETKILERFCFSEKQANNALELSFYSVNNQNLLISQPNLGDIELSCFRVSVV